MKRFTVLFILLLLVLSCRTQHLKSGIDKKDFDTSVRPQDDFYRYVDGTWLKNTKIPADKSNYGAFTVLYDKSQKALRQIIEEAAQSHAKTGTDQQKIGDFYTSFMDSNKIETLGLNPISPLLKKIQTVHSYDELLNLMAYLKPLGTQTPFSMWVGQDAKHSDHYILYLSQSGLGLPDRDYYFRPGGKFKTVREKYQQYIQTILQLGNQTAARSKAQHIFNLEKEIAQHHWTRVKNRDRDKTYNRMTIKQLTGLTPHFNWQQFFTDNRITKAEELVVRQPDYLQAFDTIFKKTSLNDWKAYFIFKTLSRFAGYLPQRFVAANFDFYGKTLSGTKVNRPRWKRAVSTVEGALGEVVGRLYVKKYFKPEAKRRMKVLVDNLIASYRERLKNLDWMSEQTKKAALAKLSKFHAKIGYPDKWKDYSKLTIKPGDLIGNEIRSTRFDYEYNLNKLGKPVDRGEWHMYPQTVNAYYNPSMNEVVFPAAILQPPFFDMQADDAVNYGAIGSVIGHELTHGFDDQGSKSDGDGNLHDWWTQEDRKRFEERTQKLAAQYSSYIPIDTLHLNGKLTLGENIADLGGVTVAYYAYQHSLHGKPAPVIEGFTGDQRFFIGWAQVWKRKYRPNELRRRILTDPHSPSRFRANGVLTNFDPFYKAFSVQVGDKMYKAPDKRIVIW